MQDKMEKLLEQINMKDDYLENASIEKIVVYDKKNLWEFVINNEKILPVYIYEELYNKLINTFFKIEKINIIINTQVDSNEYLNDYFDNLMTSLCKNSIKYKAFIGRSLNVEKNDYIFEVYNKVEYSYMIEKLEYLNKMLYYYGFKNKIKINLTEEKGIEILSKIEKEKVVSAPSNIKKIGKEENKVEEKKYYKPKKNTNVMMIKDILFETDNVTVEASLFGIDMFEAKSGYKIITLKATDNTDSIYIKMFTRDDEEYKKINELLKEGCWYRFYGKVQMDKFANELSLITRYNDIEKIDSPFNEDIMDNADEKRVELHTHTMMSQMDGVLEITKLLKQAIKWGHKAIAITDHNGCQSFPNAYHFVTDYNKEKEDNDKFKVIYGTELTLIDDSINICHREIDSPLLSSTYCVFDLETTGFNAGGGDSIIEIGAVLLKDGEIIDRYNELINPGRKLPPKITEVTNITDTMLKNMDNEENAIKRFVAWFKDYPMVAHNAKFDTSFIEMAYKKYDLGEFNNCIIDTMELSRAMDTSQARHSLSALVKRYDIDFDEEGHHRADYDAEATAKILAKMLKKLDNQNINNINKLNSLIAKENIYKFGRSYHANILVKNKTGLKNLFKIISLANTKYLYKTPRILRSEIQQNREGLLIGSGCYMGEVFDAARTKDNQELINVINFYDYVEVQPIECYDHLLQMHDFDRKSELVNHIKKIIDNTNEAGKFIVATGDVHHLTRDDKIYREIIVNQKVPGGGRHPLAKNDITSIPSMHFRTTDEMLSDFDFIEPNLAKEIVIDNPNKIADMVDIIEVIIETGGVPFSPRVKSDDGKSYLDCPKVVTDLVYSKAADWYGKNLPFNIEERIAKELYGDIVYKCCLDKVKEENYNISDEKLDKQVFEEVHKAVIKGFDSVKDLINNYIKKNWKVEDGKLDDETLKKRVKKELGGIIGGGFDPIYLIAQRLVKKSNDDGFLVGSRGSVGSSFVATMMCITEVNPLPAHYRCSKCKLSFFDDDKGNSLGSKYSSGFDLPDKECPNCHIDMIKDGQDMPFATFLGFNADKVPDIDLNFSDLNQSSAHEYTKVLFGIDNVYRAGTIGTVADKTAFGYVRGYFEDKGIVGKKNCEIERLAIGCTGVKRTTGQHPGGIVVIPDYMDVFDFTPFQFPADDASSAWRTTHFDYHAIQDDVLKLDILGHSDPTQLRMIQDLTGMDVTTIPLDDKETMSIFLSPEPLGITKEQIMNETGTLGIPEFGTGFTISMLVDTKPTTFAELVKISGLSHGTDVWLGNAQELIKQNIVPFKDVIGCRDDIMVYLMYHGLEPIKAFKIMEFVRKGKASKPKEANTWKEYVEIMENAGIEKWFIDSCAKIKYMFPKAHAAAYVISAFRIAWYKVHMPVYYYASWFSTKATDFNIDVMIKGYDSIKSAIVDIDNKGIEATNKDAGISESLYLALEATARGIKFDKFDLYKSKATVFDVKDDKTLIPPFRTIDGLGDVVAKNIELEAKKKEFISIEDFQNRCKVSQTLIDKMKAMGIFDGMSETSQLSLF